MFLPNDYGIYSIVFSLYSLISQLFVGWISQAILRFYNKDNEKELMGTLYLMHSIFSFFEISLLPFFLIFCLFSILSLIFKKNWSHIVLFFVMIFSLYPYIYRLFQISEINNLHQLLINNKFLPLFLSLVILPIYILLLRILTSLKKYFPGKKKTIFLILIVNILLFLILFISNRILFTDKKTENNMTQIQIVNDKNIIDIEYHDKYIFSDIIRTVNINSLYEPVLVSFTVSSPKTNPVIYSDNQYIINDINQVSFPLPLYPSDEIEFSYGTNNIEQTLEVNAIYYFDEEDKYISINKKIQIQGSNLE